MKTISKRVVLIALLAAAALMLTACQTSAPAPTATAAATAAPVTQPAEETPAGATDGAEIPDKTFTLDDLAAFDGQEGRMAYVAVDGIVYDVTNVSVWKDGKHAGGSYKAGVDATEALKAAPHGLDSLKAAVIVGRLAE